MKNKSMIALFIGLAFGLQTASAQFPIKIPKLPKTEKSKEQKQIEMPKSEPNDGQNPSKNSSDQPTKRQSDDSESKAVQKPVPTNVPVFLKDTIGIDAKTENRYWKFPSQNDFSSWLPQVGFNVFYDKSSKLRFTAEWFNPDGSLWFTEQLETFVGSADELGGISLRSADDDELFKTKATNATGVYSVKISNSKTGETVFQGKFKVSKQPHADQPQKKNLFRFYVDNDWLMAVGYAGYDIESWNKFEHYPAVMMWFKGKPEHREFEAVLFHNNKQIASTDNGGVISTIQERGGHCYQIPDTCSFVLKRFYWKNFLLYNRNYLKEKHPNTLFTGDLTGEFTVKIFYKGAQVREAKFALAGDGAPVRNSFSEQIFSTMSLIPVKATGTAEKWNPNAWKTDMFYGNLLSGFMVQ